jgi:hypothetical protein
LVAVDAGDVTFWPSQQAWSAMGASAIANEGSGISANRRIAVQRRQQFRMRLSRPFLSNWARQKRGSKCRCAV